MTAPPMSIPACRLRHRAQVHEALDVVVGYAGDVAAVEVHAAGTSTLVVLNDRAAVLEYDV